MNSVYKKIQILLLALLSFLAPGLLMSQDNSVSFRCEVYNGTTGQKQSPDRAMLVIMKNAPEVLETLERPTADLVFSPVKKTIFPIMIQAVYGGVTYSTVIAEEHFNSKMPHKITVYDKGAASRDIHITSMIHIVRKKTSLHVTEIYSVDNRSSPGRVFSPENLNFSVPEKAGSIQAMVQHEKAGVTSSVQLASAEKGKKLLYDFKPGVSGLSLEYDIPANTFSGISILEDGSNRNDAVVFSKYKILIWQPSDAVPVVSGGTAADVEIPDIGKAMKIDYETGADITYTFNSGSFVIDNPREMRFNPIFDDSLKTVVGLLIIFLLLIIVSYYAIRYNPLFVKK